jgi:hypothetical protein
VATVMPDLGAFTLVGFSEELKVICGSEVHRQVLKVETVDVTNDSKAFVLYLVYLYNCGPRRSCISGDLPYA